MLVEDSEGEALLVKQRLREAGFSEPLYHISDPLEALKYFQGEAFYSDRRKYPIPEILLLDLSMPKLDGFQLLRWIRSQQHLAPMVVVMLTAELDPRRISLAYQLGANSYLAKDGSMEEYENFVEFFRSYAAIANSTPQMVENDLPTLTLPHVPKGADSAEPTSQATGAA